MPRLKSTLDQVVTRQRKASKRFLTSKTTTRMFGHGCPQLAKEARQKTKQRKVHYPSDGGACLSATIHCPTIRMLDRGYTMEDEDITAKCRTQRQRHSNLKHRVRSVGFSKTKLSLILCFTLCNRGFAYAESLFYTQRGFQLSVVKPKPK